MTATCPELMALIKISNGDFCLKEQAVDLTYSLFLYMSVTFYFTDVDAEAVVKSATCWFDGGATTNIIIFALKHIESLDAPALLRPAVLAVS